MPNFSRMENGIAIVTLLFFFILVEWLGRERQYAIAKLELNTNKPIRYTFYYTIFFLIIYFKGSQQEFILLSILRDEKVNYKAIYFYYTNCN